MSLIKKWISFITANKHDETIGQRVTNKLIIYFFLDNVREIKMMKPSGSLN